MSKMKDVSRDAIPGVMTDDGDLPLSVAATGSPSRTEQMLAHYCGLDPSGETAVTSRSQMSGPPELAYGSAKGRPSQLGRSIPSTKNTPAAGPEDGKNSEIVWSPVPEACWSNLFGTRRAFVPNRPTWPHRPSPSAITPTVDPQANVSVRTRHATNLISGQTSNDGVESRINVTAQLARPEVRVVAHSGSNQGGTAQAILDCCVGEFESYEKEQGEEKSRSTSAQKHLHQALAHALRLHEFDQKNPGTLDRLYAKHGIAEVEGGRNPFIRLARLTLRTRGERETGQRSHFQRCAATLRFAEESRISWRELPAAIEIEGGVGKCAKRDAAAHPTPEGQRAQQKRDEYIELLRQQGVPFGSPVVRHRMLQGCRYLLLVEILDNGPMVLSLMEVDEQATKKWPLFSQDA